MTDFRRQNTTQYLAKMMSAADSVLKTDYGISNAEGLSSAARYMMAMQSPAGIFNYGDGIESKQLVPEIIYLSEKYGDMQTAVTTGEITSECYRKAVKDEKNLYVPVVTKYLLEPVDGRISEEGYKVTEGTEFGEVGGIGGKTADDTAAVFLLTQTVGGNLTRVERGGLISDGIYTYEVSVYADGDACAQIMRRNSGFLVSVAADGTVMYDEDGTVKTWSETAEGGKWHRITVTFDKPRGRCHIIVDGKRLTNLTAWSSEMSNFSMRVKSGSKGSRVAFDDFKKYKGFYDNNDAI